MKRYHNPTTNKWYTEGQSMTHSTSNEVFSGVPSEEQLTAWGYDEYVEPIPTPAQLLERAKQEKLAELDSYDSSEAVNSFTLGNQTMWLTRDERTQIDESINAYKKKGETYMTKYFGGMPYTFPLTLWETMLNELIVYASEALNVTEAHKAAINALESVEEVEAYDFTISYPEKLSF